MFGNAYPIQICLAAELLCMQKMQLLEDTVFGILHCSILYNNNNKKRQEHQCASVLQEGLDRIRKAPIYPQHEENTEFSRTLEAWTT